MGKMIVPSLALVAVGIAAWFLLSKDQQTTTVPEVKPTAAEVAPASTAQNAATPRTPRRPIVKNALPRRPRLERPKSGVANVGGPATAAPFPPDSPAAVAPPSERPIFKQPLVAVQASVRQYFGNLPKSGKVPGRVTLEEVLPAGVIEQLGAPSDAQITMLGPFPIDDVQAFKDVLAMDQRYDTMLGVTWTREDGTPTRDYIALEAPETPSPQ